MVNRYEWFIKVADLVDLSDKWVQRLERENIYDVQYVELIHDSRLVGEVW